MNQNTLHNNNPHSTTSPKSSPNNISITTTNSSQLTPTHTDENDNNNNNVDEGFENDNISVTGSPLQANSTEDEERHSPSPLQSSGDCATGGAFTSLIQRNTNNFKKADFIGGFSSHIQQHPQTSPTASSIPIPPGPPIQQQQQQQQHAFNHALAAQLFLQSPLMPHPSHWLYTQLYGTAGYGDLPWFRPTLQTNNAVNQNNGFRVLSNHGESADEHTRRELNHLNLAKRSITLISHNADDEGDNCSSPPVTSTKRTPSPDDDVEIVSVNNSKKGTDTLGPIKSRTPKHVDVWRPY